MKPNQKAENQISGFCMGLRETITGLEAVGEDDCTHREWKEKEAILKRLRAALKAVEPPASMATDQNATITAIRDMTTERARRSENQRIMEARAEAITEALGSDKPN